MPTLFILSYAQFIARSGVYLDIDTYDVSLRSEEVVSSINSGMK